MENVQSVFSIKSLLFGQCLPVQVKWKFNNKINKFCTRMAATLQNIHLM